MITASAPNLNDIKVEDASHLRGMGCYLRLRAQTSHDQLIFVHSRLQPSAGFPNVVAYSAAVLRSLDNGRHLLLRDQIFSPNERMVSFNVVSLFTSIPQALGMEAVSDLLRQNYDGGDGQPTAQYLIELMGHCFKIFFIFEGITCEQVKGTATGSPISGLIAGAFLRKLERGLFEEYEPKFGARYVDVTFVVINRDKNNYRAELLNSIIPDPHFTMEEE
nr:unnamed protein product [Spirometra erinaceieuropaei]